MSGFTEYQASGASDLGGRPDAVLTWEQAQRMLALVRRIVLDIVHLVNRVAVIEPEKARLDRQRHDLAWPERQRRYQLTDELSRSLSELQIARVELDALSVVLLDAELGLVGFPTLVNNQRAFFSWKPGEESVEFWQFADNGRRRTVPAAWKDVQEAVRSK
jgi:hypothetical protein